MSYKQSNVLPVSSQFLLRRWSNVIGVLLTLGMIAMMFFTVHLFSRSCNSVESFTFSLRMDSKQEQHILLWKSFKSGDWEAYTSLYHAYYRSLNNYGHKFTRDLNLIEDAIHDLFVTLWTNRDNLGNPISVKNY